MAIIYSYPTAIPEVADLLVGTEINSAGEDSPKTRTFTIGSVVTLAKSLISLQDVVSVGNTITVPVNRSKGIDITLANLETVSQIGVSVTVPNQTGTYPTYYSAPDAYMAYINGQSPSVLTGTVTGFGVVAHGADNFSFWSNHYSDTVLSYHSVFRNFDGATSSFASYSQGVTGGSVTTVYEVDYLGNTTGKSFIKTGGTSAQFLKADGSTSTTPTLQQVTEAGSASNIGIQISSIDEYSIVGNSETGIGIYGYSDEGVGVYGYSEIGRAISAYGVSGIGLEIYGNGSGTPSIDMNLGNSNKGLVIDSGTSSTGNPIEVNKNGALKFRVNQAGDVVANQLISNYIYANSSVLVVDADGATLTLDGGGSQIIANQPFIAESIAKSGGTSTQFLKADGSTDSSVFQKIIARTSANSSGAGSTGQIVVGSVLIPANSFVAGDWINLKTYISKLGTNAGMTISVYINTISSISEGATILGTYSADANFVGGQFSREWILNGSEIRGFYFSTASSLTGREAITTTFLPSNAAFNVTTAYYMLVAVQMGSVSDEYTYRGINITN